MLELYDVIGVVVMGEKESFIEFEFVRERNFRAGCGVRIYQLD